MHNTQTTTTTTTTATLKHYLGCDLIPNHVSDLTSLPDTFVHFARSYLQNLPHNPSALLLNTGETVRAGFERFLIGNKGSVVGLYSQTIQLFSSLFVEEADQLSPRDISFVQCQPTDGVCADWEWRRGGTARMVIEHKGRKVFDNFCDAIRNLARANGGAGSPLRLNATGRATGATAILIKVGPPVHLFLHVE